MAKPRPSQEIAKIGLCWLLCSQDLAGKLPKLGSGGYGLAEKLPELGSSGFGLPYETNGQELVKNWLSHL